jgi:hypothetical protein
MNTTMNTIPNGPNDMPPEWRRDPRNIQQAITALEEFEFVEMLFVRNEDTDGDGGTWQIEIQGSGTLRVRAAHPQFANALWFAVTMADAAAQEAVEQRKAAREAALAKLTTEERRMLGL